MRKLDCFEFCHLQIGDKAYYTVKDSDAVLHKMSPHKHVTPDIVELTAKDNVIVIGTKSDTLVVKKRGVEKIEGESNTGTPDKGDNPKTFDKDNSEKDSDTEKAEDESGDDEFEDVEGELSDKEESDREDCDSPVRQSGPTPKTCKKSENYHPSCKKKGSRRKGRKRNTKKTEREVKPGDKVPVEICYTFSCCDIMWQV